MLPQARTSHLHTPSLTYLPYLKNALSALTTASQKNKLRSFYHHTLISLGTPISLWKETRPKISKADFAFIPLDLNWAMGRSAMDKSASAKIFLTGNRGRGCLLLFSRRSPFFPRIICNNDMINEKEKKKKEKIFSFRSRSGASLAICSGLSALIPSEGCGCSGSGLIYGTEPVTVPSFPVLSLFSCSLSFCHFLLYTLSYKLV